MNKDMWKKKMLMRNLSMNLSQLKTYKKLLLSLSKQLNLSLSLSLLSRKTDIHTEDLTMLTTKEDHAIQVKETLGKIKKKNFTVT